MTGKEGKETETWASIQKDRQTNRQADRHKDRQIHVDGLADIQIDDLRDGKTDK